MKRSCMKNYQVSLIVIAIFAGLLALTSCKMKDSQDRASILKSSETSHSKKAMTDTAIDKVRKWWGKQETPNGVYGGWAVFKIKKPTNDYQNVILEFIQARGDEQTSAEDLGLKAIPKNDLKTASVSFVRGHEFIDSLGDELFKFLDKALRSNSQLLYSARSDSLGSVLAVVDSDNQELLILDGHGRSAE